MAEQQQESRLTGPRKKGIRSIVYGALVGAGYLIGGLPGIVMTGAAAAYSGIKGAMSVYKSTRNYNKKKSDSYLGRGLSYLGRAAGTLVAPWLQSVLSMISGVSRVHYNKDIKYLDYPDIQPYEAALKKKIEEAAAKKMEEEKKG